MTEQDEETGAIERRTLWIVLLLSSMALGLIGGVHLLSLLLGIGGTIALLVAFAVLS